MWRERHGRRGGGSRKRWVALYNQKVKTGVLGRGLGVKEPRDPKSQMRSREDLNLYPREENHTKSGTEQGWANTGWMILQSQIWITISKFGLGGDESKTREIIVRKGLECQKGRKVMMAWMRVEVVGTESCIYSDNCTSDNCVYKREMEVAQEEKS